jgi:hypothetical protein
MEHLTVARLFFNSNADIWILCDKTVFGTFVIYNVFLINFLVSSEIYFSCRNLFSVALSSMPFVLSLLALHVYVTNWMGCLVVIYVIAVCC